MSCAENSKDAFKPGHTILDLVKPNKMTLLGGILPDDRWNRSLMAAFLVLWALSCIRLPHPEYFVIQHLPTVLATIALIVAERKHVVDRLGFTLIVLFLMLHLLGARYL